MSAAQRTEPGVRALEPGVRAGVRHARGGVAHALARVRVRVRVWAKG